MLEKLKSILGVPKNEKSVPNTFYGPKKYLVNLSKGLKEEEPKHLTWDQIKKELEKGEESRIIWYTTPHGDKVQVKPQIKSD